MAKISILKAKRENPTIAEPDPCCDGLKISEMTEKTNLSGEEMIPVQSGPDNFKVKASEIAKLGGGGGNEVEVNDTGIEPIDSNVELWVDMKSEVDVMEEAPINGKSYNRKNGAWAEFSGSGLSDPDNNITYVATKSEYDNMVLDKRIKYPNVSYVEDINKVIYLKLEYKFKASDSEYLGAAIASLYDAGLISTPDGITQEEYDSNYMDYTNTGLFDNYGTTCIRFFDEDDIPNYRRACADYPTDTSLEPFPSYCSYVFYDGVWESAYVYSTNESNVYEYVLMISVRNTSPGAETPSYKKMSDYLKTI